MIMPFIRSVLKRKQRAIVTTMPYLDRERKIDVFENQYTNEYIRLSTLELLGHEIITKKLGGEMAELGVYKGQFAAKMNQMLPDKKLYLFDTFQGFDSKQEETDRKTHGLSFSRDFSDTSIKYVLSQMPYPSNCIIKKGVFPESINGLEDEFCLVSLDADLFEPIYNGLCWFWPRLKSGGFILVHDYNNSLFPGAKSAVSQFAQEYHVPFVPITDQYGTAIFAK